VKCIGLPKTNSGLKSCSQKDIEGFAYPR